MHAMPERLRPALGLAVGLCTLLLSGCGGGGAGSATVPAGGSASTATAAARAAFVARAEAVCRVLSTQEQPLKARQESLKGLQTASAERAFVSLVRQLASFSRAAEGKLQAIPRPSADARAIEGLLASFSGEITDVADIATAAANQEGTIGEGAEQTLRKSIAKNSALAARYGMKECVGAE